MELYPMHGVVPVSQPHDLTVFCFCRDFQTGWKAFSFDSQRMVTGGNKRIGHAMKNAASVMVNLRNLTVHQVRSTHDPAAKSNPNSLMTQADAEDGQFLMEVLDQGYDDSC